MTPGLTQMRQGLEALRSTGAAIERPWLLSGLARAYAHVGRTDESLAVLEEAMATVPPPATGKHLDEAGLYLNKGKSSAGAGWHQATGRRQTPRHVGTRACVIARRQQAKTSGAAGRDERRAGCGKARASVTPLMHSCPRSMAGLPRGLTPPSSRRRRHSWRSWREHTGEDNLPPIHNVQLRHAQHHIRLSTPALLAARSLSPML